MACNNRILSKSILFGYLLPGVYLLDTGNWYSTNRSHLACFHLACFHLACFHLARFHLARFHLACFRLGHMVRAAGRSALEDSPHFRALAQRAPAYFRLVYMVHAPYVMHTRFPTAASGGIFCSLRLQISR
jgi:hypothetical protein